MISGIHNSLDTLHLLSNARTRSISPENPTGEVGRGGGRDRWRDIILRIYWDGQTHPSVEVPLGDFFANGWGEYAHVNSLPICTNPARGFNCYWTMPFRKHARITVENRYIDGIEGKGQYVGTYLAWQGNNNGWWGEGEIKFYLDDDTEFPTICGTGTEDYICGAYNFDVPGQGYTTFSTPYSGMPQVIRPDGLYRSQMRFGMYRRHITDPIRFERRLRITIQDLGWRTEHRFNLQQSSIASVAYWYQTLPTAPFAPLGDRNALEII